MRWHKIKRESLRLLKNAVRDYPKCFKDNFRRRIIARWNLLQRDEEAAQEHIPHCRLLLRDNELTLLNLDFLTGFGETVHPDVVFVPDGWRKAEWRYLMALTPMPRGAEYFENPEFVVSNDGINWHLPEGGSSPVVPAPDEWLGFNSDPSLLLVEDTLYLYYRDIREYEGNEVEVRILVRSTRDGVCWSSPVSIFSQRHARKYPAVLMSPTVLNMSGRYYMWFVSVSDGKYDILKTESSDMLLWTKPEKTFVNGLDAEEYPWHIDVVDDGGRLVMVLCVSDAKHFRRKSLCFASSDDNGLKWNVCGRRMRPGDCGFGEESLYRGSLVRETNDNKWKLYYSGQDSQKHWYTVVKIITLPS